MTPELIAAVLALPLSVRVALLEADPTGAGWLIPHDAETVANCYVVGYVSQHEYKRVRGGAAWLPSNPLAILRHASDTYNRRHGRWRSWPCAAFGNDEWVMSVDRYVNDERASVVKYRHASEHRCAVRILACVLGHDVADASDGDTGAPVVRTFACEVGERAEVTRAAEVVGHE